MMGPIASLAWADFLLVVVRATVLLSGAILVGGWLRSVSARARHLVWTGTFVLLLALPAAAVWLPPLEVAVLPASAESVPVVAASGAATFERGLAPAPAARASALEYSSKGAATGPEGDASLAGPGPAAEGLAGPVVAGSGVAAFLALVWSMGVLVGLGSLALGNHRFRVLVRSARPVTDPRVFRRAGVLKDRVGVTQNVRLVMADGISSPMAGGVRRPVIILPRGAARWSDDRLDVVLTHEMIHVRRNDALRHFIGCVALAVYWFHPLSWIASRVATANREQACDEEVVSLGTRPSEYARHLVALADTLSPATPPLASLSMVQQSQLERRVMSILAPGTPSQNSIVTGLTFVMFCIFGVTAAFAIPVALQGPAQEAAVSAVPVGPPPVGVPAQMAVRPLAPVQTVPLVPVLPGAQSIAVSPPGSPVAPPAGGFFQTPAGQEQPSCRAGGRSGSFNGSMATGDGRIEWSGWQNGDRVIQRYIENVRLCFRRHGDVVMNDEGTEVRAVGQGSWVALEAEEDGVQRLVISEGPSGIEYAWTVDGDARPFDSQAREWHDRMLSVLSAYWEASALRGQRSTLRGQISSMKGHVSSLEGKISSHRGRVSSLKGQISSMRGSVSSMNGQISSHRGRVSSLNGQISSLRGEMSSLRAAARTTSNAATKARLERELEEYEASIEDIQRQIQEYDLEARVGEIQEEVAEYDVEARVREVEQEIEAYDLNSKVEQLEREIEAYGLDSRIEAKEREIAELDAERRAEAIEAAAAPELDALLRLIRGF